MSTNSNIKTYTHYYEDGILAVYAIENLNTKIEHYYDYDRDGGLVHLETYHHRISEGETVTITYAQYKT